MSAIVKTIWRIEVSFGETLTLDDIAAHAGVSRSHLSRMFPLATGYSLFAYLRGRRLSEAAKALAGGAPDILAVALDAGYNSHEAFTRAFKDQFGITPEEVRRRRSLKTLQLVEPLPMTTPDTVSLPDPTIEHHAAMQVAGLVGRHEMSTANTVPAQWQRLQPFLGHVPGAVGRVAYGIVGDTDEHSFEYLCGVEVKGGAELPPEFSAWSIPAQRYARFPHRGHISTIRSTISAIFRDWLPRSGLETAPQFNMIEYYGPDFDGQTGMGTVEIWLGLRD